MVTKHLSTKELINLTEAELAKTGFSNFRLEKIKLVWSNLEKYLFDKNINHFSLNLGLTFLKEMYRLTETSNLSSTNRIRLRAIHLLADFQAHQRIFIRRKQKRYEFAQPFEKIFFEFIDVKKNAGISTRTLESYFIYLERLSQYLVNHDVNHVTEIRKSHIHGFIQSSAAIYSTSTIYCTCSLLRVLFRYLFAQKMITEDLSIAVPSIKCSKKSKSLLPIHKKKSGDCFDALTGAIQKESEITPYY